MLEQSLKLTNNVKCHLFKIAIFSRSLNVILWKNLHGSTLEVKICGQFSPLFCILANMLISNWANQMKSLNTMTLLGSLCYSLVVLEW